jgi:hypothetical protein
MGRVVTASVTKWKFVTILSCFATSTASTSGCRSFISRPRSLSNHVLTILANQILIATSAYFYAYICSAHFSQTPIHAMPYFQSRLKTLESSVPWRTPPYPRVRIFLQHFCDVARHSPCLLEKEGLDSMAAIHRLCHHQVGWVLIWCADGFGLLAVFNAYKDRELSRNVALVIILLLPITIKFPSLSTLHRRTVHI